MRDELREDELSKQIRRKLEAPVAVPARRKRRVDPPDLRADQAHATAVKTAAEVERHGLVAVPRAHDHGSLGSDRVDRLLKRGGTAARFDGDVRAAASGE